MILAKKDKMALMQGGSGCPPEYGKSKREITSSGMYRPAQPAKTVVGNVFGGQSFTTAGTKKQSRRRRRGPRKLKRAKRKKGSYRDGK